MSSLREAVSQRVPLKLGAFHPPVGDDSANLWHVSGEEAVRPVHLGKGYEKSSPPTGEVGGSFWAPLCLAKNTDQGVCTLALLLIACRVGCLSLVLWGQGSI